MDIGSRIAQLRKKHELSQEAFGEICGVTRQAISKWEAGLSFPDIEKLVIISEHFEVSAGWLLGVEDEVKRVDPDKISEEINKILEEYFSMISKSHPEDEEIVPEEPVRGEEDVAGRKWTIKDYILTAVAGFLFINSMILSSDIEDLSNAFMQVSNSVTINNNRHENEIVNLQSEIESLRGANPYVTDFGYDYISYDPVENTVEVLVSFIPQEMKKSSTVTVHTGGSRDESISQKAKYDEGAGRYFATLNLPVEENMSLFLSVDDGENVRGSHLAILDVFEQVNPVKAGLEFSDSEALLLDENGKVIKGFYNFHNFAGTFDRTFLGKQITTVKTEILVYYNGNLIDSIEMQDNGGKEQYLGIDLAEYFKDYTFKDDDSLYFRLRLTNNYGREYIPTEDISIRITGKASEVYRGARVAEVK